ncbi:MAG TPA: type VI secretion system-associated protein TagF [Stellaceae bacterium]|nr:type VI secretion system-associated protein TagF [Stellaceae bacterium]
MPAQPLTEAARAPSYYGKLPARGDFVSRRFGRAFIEAWDAWLRSGLVASKAALGSAWRDLYLTSPIWRFALAAGACGPNMAVGIMMPSVDAVGRYFPLVLGLEMPPNCDLGASVAAEGWYAALEALALAALEDGFSLDRLDAPLCLSPLQDLPLPRAGEGRGEGQLTAAPPHPSLSPEGRGFFGAAEGRGFCRRIALAETAPLPPELCLRHMAQERATLWWSAGSERVAPSLLLCSGLPQDAAFAALLDGDWRAHGWAEEAAPQSAAATAADAGEDAMRWDREG